MVGVAAFLGEATASAANPRFTPGKRHALVLFVRHTEGTSPDFTFAESQLASRGWTEIALSQAVQDFPVENLNGLHPHAGASYQDALNDGFAALVFSDSTDDAP